MTRCTPIPFTSSPIGDIELWVKPETVLALSSYRSTTVDIAGGAPTLVVRGDPKRIGIGFTYGSTAAFSFAVGPSSRPDLTGFIQPSQASNLWFNLFTHGPLVCADWYAFSSGMLSVTAWEWYRTAGV